MIHFTNSQTLLRLLDFNLRVKMVKRLGSENITFLTLQHNDMTKKGEEQEGEE